MVDNGARRGGTYVTAGRSCCSTSAAVKSPLCATNPRRSKDSKSSGGSIGASTATNAKYSAEGWVMLMMAVLLVLV